MSDHRNIRLLIAYDGTNYSGWQRQAKDVTIQGTIESCLSVITQQEITLHSAGRTDAGVHALGMVAHFHTRSTIAAGNFSKALNSMLPHDIRILRSEETDPSFHSRFDACGKTYRYDFFTGRILSPIDRLYRAHYRCKLNPDHLTDCLERITGTHDFSSFEASGSRDPEQTQGRGAVRTLFQARYLPDQGHPDCHSILFTGDGFLRHMVRNLIGTLMEAARENITPLEFQHILESHRRADAGPTAPARGLFLVQVHYDRPGLQ